MPGLASSKVFHSSGRPKTPSILQVALIEVGGKTNCFIVYITYLNLYLKLIITLIIQSKIEKYYFFLDIKR